MQQSNKQALVISYLLLFADIKLKIPLHHLYLFIYLHITWMILDLKMMVFCRLFIYSFVLTFCCR